ncbi:hypothetical protein MY3296_001990 [Beauveria thailandica]
MASSAPMAPSPTWKSATGSSLTGDLKASAARRRVRPLPINNTRDIETAVHQNMIPFIVVMPEMHLPIASSCGRQDGHQVEQEATPQVRVDRPLRSHFFA